jgi:hypothetical protein
MPFPTTRSLHYHNILIELYRVQRGAGPAIVISHSKCTRQLGALATAEACFEACPEAIPHEAQLRDGRRDADAVLGHICHSLCAMIGAGYQAISG